MRTDDELQAELKQLNRLHNAAVANGLLVKARRFRRQIQAVQTKLDNRTSETGEDMDDLNKPSKLEIIHYRDPDSECFFSYFLNGQRVERTPLEIHLTDLDPGRGYDFVEWAEIAHRSIYQNAASEAAARELYEFFENASGEYIIGLPDDDTWLDHLEGTPEDRQWWERQLPDIDNSLIFGVSN